MQGARGGRGSLGLLGVGKGQGVLNGGGWGTCLVQRALELGRDGMNDMSNKQGRETMPYARGVSMGL